MNRRSPNSCTLERRRRRGRVRKPTTARRAAGSSFVTQHSQFTPPPPSHSPTHPAPARRIVLCGVDTLDVSMHVNWGDRWPVLHALLRDAKAAAQGTSGTFTEWDGVGGVVVYERGRKPAYTYHVKTNECNLWLCERQHAGHYANVFASVGSTILIDNGVAGAVAVVKQLIRMFGGTVTAVMPSRVDLFADVLVPGGITLALLNRHKKTRCRKSVLHQYRDLFTGYELGKGGGIALRMYDKSREVENHSGKTWLYEHWKLPPGTPDVWRFEFQLRRPPLRDYRINTIDALQKRAGGVWSDLTSKFFSLRHKQGKCRTRWPMIPLWRMIHEAAPRFGADLHVKREAIATVPPPADWYVQRALSCLVGYAARRRIMSADTAVDRLLREVRVRLAGQDFPALVRAKIIDKGGVPPTDAEGEAA